MKPILVAYATNAGTTEEVARVIAEELTNSGLPAEVRRIADVTSLAPYSAAVIGAPMILGWHRGAVGFVKCHQQTLSTMPAAYFITAMSLTHAGQERIEDVPLYVDSGLGMPPKNPNRLSLKERYTNVTNYASQPLKAAPQVKPVSVGIFGGKLEMFRLNLLHALFVMLILRAPMGSLQNWTAVREWAGQLATRFKT